MAAGRGWRRSVDSMAGVVTSEPTTRHSVAVLAAGMFVVASGTNVSTPLLVLYRERLDLSTSQTMAIFVVYVVGILASLVIGGALSDRFGRKPIVLPMVGLSGVASLGMIVGRDEFIALLASRMLLGAVSGAVLGVGAAWLLELFGKSNAHRAAWTATLVSFGGFGIGPLISAILYWLAPAPLVLPFLLHAASVAVVLALMVRIPETHRAPVGHRIRPSFGVPREVRRTFALVIVPAVIWMFAFPSTAFALFPVLVGESLDGGEVAIAAAAGSLTAWSGLFARPLVGAVGARRALPIGMGAGVVGYVFGTLAFSTGIWPLLLVAAPLLGAASGTVTVGCLGLAGAMADDARRGSLTSTVYLLGYPGMTMPLIVTTLGSATTTVTALMTVTAIATLATAAVIVFGRRVPLDAPGATPPATLQP